MTSALLQIAQAHWSAHRLVEAEQICRQILKLDGRQAEAMYFLALSLYSGGETEQAIQWLRKAILIQQNRSSFYSALGTICATAGRHEDACRYHRRAAELDPNNVDYLSNAGLALVNIGQPQVAVEMFQRALALQPQHFMARNNLALALQALGNLDDALAEFQKVVLQKPDYAAGWSNLAGVIGSRDDVDGTIEASRRALALNPNHVAANHTLLMKLMYSPTLSPMEVAQEHMKWGRRYCDPVEAASAAARLPAVASSGHKIRVGYVSADFHQHPVAHFFEPLLAHHDRDQFEIFCYSSSNTVDAFARRLRSYPSQWREIINFPDEQVAALIRQDGIDILVDLNGHTEGTRLMVFARRPAPVQMSYLGYSGTTGMRQIDYFLTDAILNGPGDERLYSEQLFHLPHTFACYLPWDNSPDVAERLTRGSITFISQHPLVRLNSTMIELWSRILALLPDSRIIIARHTLTAVAQQRLTCQFESHGIDSSRLDLRKITNSDDHLRIYHEADLALDTTPWSGHTTACEALWMGCPVVTLYGASHAGRRVASVLTQLDLTDMIAHSPEEYVNIAVNLANDSSRRAGLRNNLRQIMRASPLMDGGGLTRDLEAAYKSVLAPENAS